jgi:hypothetical protein
MIAPMTSKNSRNLAIVTLAIVAAILAYSLFRTRLNRIAVTRRSVPTRLELPTAAIKAPPGGVGCYYQKPGEEKWQTVECVPESEASKLPRPQADPILEAIKNGSVVPANSLINSLREVRTSAWFSKFSGETDSGFGPGFFSIQANTNYFQGNNGDTDWAQFVYSYSPPGAHDLPMICQWSVDITQNSAPAPKCVNIPNAPALSASFGADVYGISTSVMKCGIKLPWVFGCATVSSLTAVVWTPAGSWAVIAPDYYGLSTRWNTVSGGILGISQKDTANFTSPTLISSITGAYAPWLNNVASANGGATSGETNNLNPISGFTACNGTGWCYLVSTIGN